MASQYYNTYSNLATVKLLLKYDADITKTTTNNKNFMNFLNDVDIAECFEIINTMNYAKKCQKISRAIYSRCIKSIPIASAKITDRVDSLRIRIMNIKWELEKNNHRDHTFAINIYMNN